MDGLELVWEEHGGHAFALKALVDGQVVGQACGHWEPYACELERVEVTETWRRHGVGQSLVHEVQAHADHVKACAVSAAGAKLLRECGFEDFAEPDADWVWPPDWASAGDRDF